MEMEELTSFLEQIAKHSRLTIAHIIVTLPHSGYIGPPKHTTLTYGFRGHVSGFDNVGK
jgi:hypothetical protein